MPAVVDQLPLGPLETNCYLVRAARGAPAALVVDPSGAAIAHAIERILTDTDLAATLAAGARARL